MNDKKTTTLIRAARRAWKWSYAPYSRFPVGAAVLGKNGRIYSGANVENASYGLTVCAERVAIFKAITAGEKELVALAIFTTTEDPVPPCGACLQVLGEFARNPLVILASPGKTQKWRLKDLLPFVFKFNKDANPAAPGR